MTRECYPKFNQTRRWFWTPDFGTNDISFGIHICWKGRIDIHIWTGMLSIGNVPVYTNRDGTLIAVSNSFHEHCVKHDGRPTRKSPQPRASAGRAFD
jgi:hypothetical protein